MPKVEVRTRLRPLGRNGSELIMELLLTPRGSGNRKWAVALAKAAKHHAQLGPHVKRVRAGSSKVWIVLDPSLELAKTMWHWQRTRAADVEGQLPLFGGPVPA
jgi:hypothetical protein